AGLGGAEPGGGCGGVGRARPDRGTLPPRPLQPPPAAGAAVDGRRPCPRAPPRGRAPADPPPARPRARDRPGLDIGDARRERGAARAAIGREPREPPPARP